MNSGGLVILHTRLNRMLAFDADTGIVEVEAGVTLRELIEVFLPRGWFPRVVPGTQFVTVGGAIAANVHGKNHHRDGAFAACVESFVLLTGSGDKLTCARDAHPDVFWATLGGMGLTGAILSARLRLMPISSTRLDVRYTRVRDLDALVDQLDAGDEDCRYSVAWIDCLARGGSMGRGVVMQADHADEREQGGDAASLAPVSRKLRRVPLDFPGFALNRLSVRAFNEAYYRKHASGRALEDYSRFFFPLDAVADWNRVYGKRGFVQYQAVFPEADGRAGVAALLEAISDSGQASFLAVLKRMGAADPGPLSFPMPGLTLALDLPNRGLELTRLAEALDRIVLDHGGRLYLAKDALLDAASFRAMYPRHDEFAALMRRLDPGGRFASSLSRRLKIGGDA